MLTSDLRVVLRWQQLEPQSLVSGIKLNKQAVLQL